MRPRPLPAPTHPSRTGETNQRPNRYRDVTTNNRTPTRHFLIYASNQLKRPSVTDFEDALQPKVNVPFARLRTQDGRHLFTVKKPVDNEMACLEHAPHIVDREQM